MISEMKDMINFNGIEKGLGYFMTPVDPDPDFIQKLGSRLRYPKLVSLESITSPRPVAILVLLAGFLLGAFSIFLLRKLR